jgi:hypothetical protein
LSGFGEAPTTKGEWEPWRCCSAPGKVGVYDTDAEGREMQLAVWFSILALIVGIQGCGGGSISQDEAMVVKAQRSLEKVKSTLELYRFDHGTYPPNDAVLGEILSPYIADWDSLETVSFYAPPSYETPDSTTTYFVVAQAQDRNHTMLSLRPPLTPKKKEEPQSKRGRRR